MLSCWAFLAPFFYIVKMMLAFSLSFLPKFPWLLREKEILLSAFCYHNRQNHPRQGVFLEAELKLAKKLIILSSL